VDRWAAANSRYLIRLDWQGPVSLTVGRRDFAAGCLKTKGKKFYSKGLIREQIMKRSSIIFVAIAVVVGLGATLFVLRDARVSQTAGGNESAPKAASSSLIAAPGRVEPISEELKVSSELRGKLREVKVEEGDVVKQGQVLAVLENDDYRAQVAEAQARLQQKEAELRRVINGARRQERQEAWQGVEEAKAQMENARAEANRRQSLFEKGVIAKEESDRAEREYKVTKARYDAAAERHSFVDDQAREEDRARAEADVALSRAQLDEARARLEKTFIRAPLDGVILRKHLKSGESVSDMREMPIVTMANLNRMRVRMDVDESDIGKIQMGQQAYVKADAFGEEKFYGRVVRIGQILGRKNVRTDEPSERVDTKILETLIELEDGKKLSPGLRVDSFIVTSTTTAAVER
jgi:HlyD family secretion protein